MSRHRHATSSPHSHDHERVGRRVHRRAFLKGGAVGLFSFGLGLGGGPLFLHRAARAASGSPRRKVLVTVFQRGAMDGLMAVTPLGDRHLAKLRPGLMLPSRGGEANERQIDLGNGFALHPALAPLHAHFGSGELAVVHGVGSPDATRSHFDAQDYMESGTPGDKGTRSGWLNRVVGELGHEGYAPTPFQAVAMTASLPKSFYGDEKAIAVQRLEDFQVRPQRRGGNAARLAGGFESLYAQTTATMLREAGAETFEAVDQLGRLDPAAYRPAASVRYPRSPLGESLRQIAYLIQAGVGLEVAFAESGGWDTHVRQGQARGAFANRAQDLAQAIDAFWKDLGKHRSDVVLLTMTEFGRTVAQNGSAGTDHGHGSCLFVLGENVRGGRVHGALPALARDNLYEGRDLPVTTDFRTVFSTVAQKHLGVSPEAELFPGWSGRQMPLFEA